MQVRPFQVVESVSAATRLAAALSFLRQFPPSQPITIVAATRGAADDLARRLAIERRATIGLARFSLTQIAARVASTRLAAHGIAPATMLGSEAVAARVAFEAARGDRLEYFAAVATAPGFPRALARTIGELRASGVPPHGVSAAGLSGSDLAALLAHAEEELLEAASADRARLLAEAADAAAADPALRAPLLLLDVPIESPVEERFVASLIAAAPETLAVIPAHDEGAATMLGRLGGSRKTSDPAVLLTDLDYLRRYLFADDAPPPRALDGTLQFFSAPGEARECVEIARRILMEARRGVRFDEIAILVRAPHQYHGLLEHALERSGIPAWFDRGLTRPHPAGRAFLALLGCAAEGLSARRFAEYLSLGQLPAVDQTPADTWAPSTDEVFHGGVDPLEESVAQEPDESETDRDQQVLAGTLRTPRRWERMLVEASVIGGDPARWRRRLDGLADELATRADAARREDPGSGRVQGFERDIIRLRHLRAFAMPLIEEMAGWPVTAPWGVWLARLEAFAPRVLGTPTYVLRVLADLRPMATVGPVSIDEVRSVLRDRLRLVRAEPPPRRYGRVFVATVGQVRGRTFRVVFLPGLAERMFPQKPRQDPLLLDAARERLDARLPTRAEQRRLERLLVHLAGGAAAERLYVSYPRIDVTEARVRMPSFYALDIVRGATGLVPDHETLAETAAGAGDPTLAWPAPLDPFTAVDDQEHDLAVLRALLDARDPERVRGHAQYFLRLNPALRRSVTERWARSERKWSQFDGLTRLTNGTRDALAGYRLGARPYSLTALQRFSACPYQFVLGALYRLEPAEQPEPLQRLDPLTKGSLIHRIQASFLRDLERRGALPVTNSSLETASAILADVVAAVAAEYRDRLAPAVDRVWRDEIDAIARDLHRWLRMVAHTGETWTPRYFELAFGLPESQEPRDSRSVPAPVTIAGRFTLRGSIDLVEEHRHNGSLRVTDHKTGKNRSTPATVIGGGAVLQPILYSLAVEQITNKPVAESRLSFCTTAGGFTETVIPVTVDARRAGVEALEIVDRAIERGFLAAAPAPGACTWCDFRPVCGPNEEQRIARKPDEPLRDLIELRRRP
jgi:hypothetical protein